MTELIHHDSAIKHITGESVYINDMLVSEKLLYGKVVYSKYTHAKIKKIDIKNALTVNGVKTILTYKDIPGINQMGPVIHDEPCLAENEVAFIGQAIALIAADNEFAIKEAEKLIEIE